MMMRRLFIFLWIIVIPIIVFCSPSPADKKGLIADVPVELGMLYEEHTR